MNAKNHQGSIIIYFYICRFMRIAQSIPRMSSFFKRHMNRIMILWNQEKKRCTLLRCAALKLLKGTATNGFVRPSMQASDDSPRSTHAWIELVTARATLGTCTAFSTEPKGGGVNSKEHNWILKGNLCWSSESNWSLKKLELKNWGLKKNLS